MTVTTNTTDRKALAKALADKLGTTAKYMGPPTFGYQVGRVKISKPCGISCKASAASRRKKQNLPESRRSRKRKPLIQERRIR